MSKLFIAILCGFLMALGLGIAGMTKPSVVLGFLDIAGQWNPALMFVMVGAIGVHTSFGFFVRKREQPIFSHKFYWPDNLNIDGRLFAGASVFGIGWGLSGICPGAAYINLGSLDIRIVYFVGAMLAGNFLFRLLDSFVLNKSTE
ncbi:MAG: YeeE/YedE family protein [Methylococcales bacterium]|jgi:uncharacterized protein|nr:YeeE/YedE family protein [Methylococcales bacterium]MBT7408556.1 YeeE/YedE family protein [Methylococcales bacterium]